MSRFGVWLRNKLDGWAWERIGRQIGEAKQAHVDRVGHDARPGTEKLLGRYRSVEHSDIGGQERNGSATYVYISEPHTMDECPFGPGEVVEDA